MSKTKPQLPLYLGIDNGISGALCLMDSQKKIITQRGMPVQRGRKGNELDVLALQQWFQTHVCNQTAQVTVVLEEPGGSKSYKAACSMEGSFHTLRAVVQMLGLRLVRITPQSWQKPLLNAATGENKSAALTKARELFPQESWLLTPKCSTPDTGLIDAALIAYWGMYKNL